MVVPDECMVILPFRAERIFLQKSSVSVLLGEAERIFPLKSSIIVLLGRKQGSSHGSQVYLYCLKKREIFLWKSNIIALSGKVTRISLRKSNIHDIAINNVLPFHKYPKDSS